MAQAREDDSIVADIGKRQDKTSSREVRPESAGFQLTAPDTERRWPKGLGWRARLGVIIPQLDLLTEPLLAQLLPPGISFYTSRLRRTGPVNVDTLHEMNRHFDSALTLLPLPYLDMVIYHCTMGSLYYDPARLVSDIEAQAHLPGVATLQAAMDALRHLETRRITLVTPYPKSFNEAEAKFLEDKGFSIVSVGGEHFDDAGIMAMISPDDISLWVRRARRPETEAVFISCTGIRSLEFIDELEADLQIPVVTSTSAMLWQVLRRLHVNETIAGLGTLLR